MQGINFWNYYTRQDLGYQNKFFTSCRTRNALNQFRLKLVPFLNAGDICWMLVTKMVESGNNLANFLPTYFIRNIRYPHLDSWRHIRVQYIEPARSKADVTYLVEQWNHIYDVEFTKETFETPIRNNQVQMMVLIHQIDEIRAKIGEFKKKDPTVTKEFKFHELNIRGKRHLGSITNHYI